MHNETGKNNCSERWPFNATVRAVYAKWCSMQNSLKSVFRKTTCLAFKTKKLVKLYIKQISSSSSRYQTGRSHLSSSLARHHSEHSARSTLSVPIYPHPFPHQQKAWAATSAGPCFAEWGVKHWFAVVFWSVRSPSKSCLSLSSKPKVSQYPARCCFLAAVAVTTVAAAVMLTLPTLAGNTFV